MKTRLLALAIAASLAGGAYALDLNDLLNAGKAAMEKKSGTQPGTSATQSAIDALTPTEMNAGLKEALTRGAEAAVAQLGKQDGFFGDPKLRIPLPDNLKKVDKLMRTFGMGKQADELVLSMNRAAEAAVPEAKTLLVNAVKDMSVEEAKGILTGGDQAATDFFRKKTETALTEKFLPMVKTATGQVGLAQTYNQYAGLASKFKMVKEDQASIENYVTKQSLDRLYKVIGEQERAIRTNPIQYGSDLLKKVFGAVMGK
ncbi:MAG: DUF4197 domain-containing protein [Hydrogenophilaceae bacterium]|nr:DUF4197 domain-containing protein [Hydrogenophilaceae bacterium]